MQKELSEMTLEELWELFPIFLVPHNEKWDDDYDEMTSLISKQYLTDFQVARISHIGSTAIQGIYAKNIVDILMEINEDTDMEKVASALEHNGFTRMSGGQRRISLNKGYTKQGFSDKVYHLHIRFLGDNDELYFRDYLNEFPQIAKEYETLKLKLWKMYEHNREAYTDAKTDFIREKTNEAKLRYGKRY